MAKKKLILASGSPRRKMFFTALGFDFEQEPSRYEEDLTLDLVPEKLVCFLSQKKAEEVASRKSGIIVASDTMVFCDGKALGKPKNRAECLSTLRHLSGRSHSVISAITIIDTDTGKMKIAFDKTEVVFRKLSDDEIAAYEKTGEPYDRAGSYGIQDGGCIFVERLNGCYTNVVGLPIPLLLRMIKEFNVKRYNAP